MVENSNRTRAQTELRLCSQENGWVEQEVGTQRLASGLARHGAELRHELLVGDAAVVVLVQHHAKLADLVV